MTRSDPVVCRMPPSLMTFIIHASGRIERLVPKDIAAGYERRVKYLYVPHAGAIHDVGTYGFSSVARRAPGNVVTSGTVNLIDLREVKPNYDENGVRYGFSLNTNRYFIADAPLASFLGAMFEVGYPDLVCNGFSDGQGRSIGGSQSHMNGTNGDFRYLRNDGRSGPLYLAIPPGEAGQARPDLLDEERQAAFNRALQRFGWKSLLSYRYRLDGQTKLLPLTKHFENHHHHLHVQGYNPHMVQING